MNPFLHPAVATPLEPDDDVLVWSDGAVVPLPDATGTEPSPTAVAPTTARLDTRQPGLPPVGSASMGNVGRGLSLRGFNIAPRPSAAHGCARAWSSPAARRLSTVWRGRARSLAFVTAIGLGAGGLAMAQSPQVDVNVATATELEAIKGIGPKTAHTIISERQRSGPFESFQDFSERIRGIGPKRAASLRAAGLVIGAPASQRYVVAPPGPDTGSAPVGVLVR